MSPDRKWPVVLAFGLLVACGGGAIARDWQWAFLAVAAMVLVLALVVGTDLKSLGITASKEGGAFSIERAKAETAKANEKIEHVAEELASGTVFGRATESVGGPEMTDADVERRRREQVERLMDAAAQGGWLQAKAGAFVNAPRPEVEWAGDKPRILYWTTARRE